MNGHKMRSLVVPEFRIPHGKYWNEFYRKWMPDPEVKQKAKGLAAADEFNGSNHDARTT